MFCEKCGSKLQENDMFCQNCGAKVLVTVTSSASDETTSAAHVNSSATYSPENQPNYVQENNYAVQSPNPYHPEKREKSPNKRKKIIVGTASGVAAAAVITGSIVTYNVLTSPSYKATKLINEEKYDEAFEMYANSDKEPDFVKKLTNSIIKKLDSIKKEFTNKKISYEDATQQLEEIKQFSFPSVQSHITEVSDYIKNMSKSFDSFDKGTEAMSKEKYADAIEYLKGVDKEDPSYDTAQDSLKEAVDKYSKKILEESSKLTSSNDYKGALKKLKTALNAIKPLSKKGEDKQLQAKFDEYKKKFVSEVLVQSQNEKANEKYDAAISIVVEAIDITDDESLKSELAKLQAEKPKTLEELKLSQSENFTQITDLTITEDAVGNKYSPNNLFQISAKADGWGSGYEGYADYYLNYKYKKLKGTISVADTSDATNATLTIYGDKKILYTSGTLNRTTSPKQIDIDISNVDWLEVRITTDENAPDGVLNVLMSDFKFAQ